MHSSAIFWVFVLRVAYFLPIFFFLDLYIHDNTLSLREKSRLKVKKNGLIQHFLRQTGIVTNLRSEGRTRFGAPKRRNIPPKEGHLVTLVQIRALSRLRCSILVGRGISHARRECLFLLNENEMLALAPLLLTVRDAGT
jgi:hypothetical protein